MSLNMKNHKRIYLLNFLLICLYNWTIAQSISGIITNTQGEELVGATIYLSELQAGTTSNLSGQFSMKNIPTGTYTLISSFIGYSNDTTTVNTKEKDLQLSITLQPTTNSINEIVVQADKLIERTTISNISFSKTDLRTSHGLTEDPLRTLASLPGIGRGGDLFSPSALYVRGGSPDENLFLLDNNKIFFPYYFGGQKSVFNTDVTESIELLTGGFSAMYGNHLSSVLNVTTRDGDKKRIRGMLSFGFYNASGIVEGPIKKDTTSFLVAVRRTYLDLFLKENAAFPVPSFGDVTFKLSHILNDKHKISLSGISSDESLDFLVADPQPGLPNKLKTGGNNHFQSLQLQSKLSDKIYNKLSITNALSNSNAEVGANLYLDINAWQAGFRNDMILSFNSHNKFKAGLEWQYGKFQFDGTFPLDPLQTDPNDTTVVLRQESVNHKDESNRSAYFLYDAIVWSKLGINAGLRWDFNPENNKSDFSPRISLNYQLAENNKLRFATGIYHQFPSIGSGANLVSERAIHYILGYEHKISQNIYGWIEAYLKDYNSLVNYDLQFNASNSGKGNAKGIELFLRKEQGKIRGWISYAFSHSQRTAPLSTVIKDFAYDQRHIANLVAQYHILSWKEKNKWYLPVLLHTNIRYADGTPYTPIIAAEKTAVGWSPIPGDLLSKRNSDYFNVNLRIEWEFKIGKKGKGTSFMEAWNLTNKRNVLGRNYQYGNQYPNNVKTSEYYATPFLMAGGFRIEF